MTLVEIISVIAIFIIIFGIGSYVFINARRSSELRGLTDTIALTLEQAKSNALIGKGGLDFGLRFAADSYTYFSGSSYVPSDTSNQVHGLSTGYQIANTFASTSGVVVFRHLTGLPQATGTVTITALSDPSDPQTIIIGSQGEITVIK